VLKRFPSYSPVCGIVSSANGPGFEGFWSVKVNLQATSGGFLVAQGHRGFGLIYNSCVLVHPPQATRPGLFVFPYRIFNNLCLSSYGETPGGWSLSLIQRATPRTFVVDHSPCGVDMAKASQTLCRLMFGAGWTLTLFSGCHCASVLCCRACGFVDGAAGSPFFSCQEESSCAYVPCP